jgi:hypothetical protein
MNYKVGFITLNLGDAKKATYENWEYFFNNMLADISRHDIIAIATQEDQPKSLVLQAAETKLKHLFQVINFQGNPLNVSEKFVVHICVLVKHTIGAVEVHQHDGLILKSVLKNNFLVKNFVPKGIFVTKSSLPIYITIGHTKIAFYGCHFPFGKQFDDTERDNSLLLVKKHIIDNKPDVAFVFGDLNYRFEYNSKENGLFGYDHLLEHLNKTKDFLNVSFKYSHNRDNIVQELDSNIDFAPTCKIKLQKTDDNDNRRLPVCSNIFKKKEYPSKDDIQQCYFDKGDDEYKRNPSYCDRVIYTTPNPSINVEHINSSPIIHKPMNMSDHNGLFVEVIITTATTSNTNGNTYGGKTTKMPPKLTATKARVAIGKRNAVVYETTRGTKYIKSNGNYVKLSALKPKKSS